ncbi:hypothetical protein D0869_06313 [Hortaea werneckii]|uniref:Uncharacterized protein n=1 Tax=Hortaea werneckii TaxID=91943 RepID=A0A3M7BQG6_HORWE|nr:hypothetical protein KC334_g2356 [Hortaea werneckii]KAI7019399.1 hypothetical protein KC355_g3065 [Hortaea werneckii]KAI7187850.1 hypothetical protein KC324_g6787 [Hortaea werneckii]KAI7588559.1 hypothetical protein KC316_g4418 [Hortaea werneckii]KAI7672522.1 hypothetical protein KC318_g2816 [Hortaea werneckii]
MEIVCPIEPLERRYIDLPAEIRMAILEYVFAGNRQTDGFKNHNAPGGLMFDENYAIAESLQPLMTCRQMYHDACLLAFHNTAFVTNSLFIANKIPERLAVLHPKQIAAIRSITFVADARHFRKLIDWGDCPFGMRQLQLDTLTLVLHKSSFWHYLFDFTSDVVQLLRNLQGVRRLVFVRNDARVKGSFHTWYNRLVGLIMKVDHHERYNKSPCNPERVWWQWKFDPIAQSICLEALPSKTLVAEEAYMQQMKPLLEELQASVENEEWNPDPRVRNGT